LHTSFRVGGPADIFLSPASAEEIIHILQLAGEEGMPVFTLGGGANILVADKGIRGIVMELGHITDFRVSGTELVLGTGLPISEAAARAADLGLGGLDFLYAMPGSVGGAVWMNARCYGSEISEVLLYVDYITRAGEHKRMEASPELFAYKASPFQDGSKIIYEAAFQMRPSAPEELWSRMLTYRSDRDSKGHFAAPSAGSVFKNNRSFGAPTGQLLDRLGLKGFQIGNAKISDHHANIIVNTGAATASDIRNLIHFAEEKALAELGIELEREVLISGDWTGWARLRSEEVVHGTNP
jgi:UDP-N-acetylmuramate dehydrogenase